MNDETWTEIQVDRLVGPTHHFGGLGVGNLASQHHVGQPSNPSAAAIQGLQKMRLIGELGVPQWIMPPQVRPDFSFLRAIGFTGDDSEILKRAYEDSPLIFSAAMSSSAMWTANAATVSTSNHSEFETVMTVANLNSSLHRAIEPPQTMADLRAIFGGTIKLYPPLIGGVAMRDEGAANHMRLSGNDPSRILDVFVHGDLLPEPINFMARQSLASFEAIARRHGLGRDAVFFLKQHPSAIDAGAFHNDVVAMSHGDLLIHHELAFAPSDHTMSSLDDRFLKQTGTPLRRIVVRSEVLSIQDAIATYLFNSQIVSLPVRRDEEEGLEGAPVIICPIQVAGHPVAKQLVTDWQLSGLFSKVIFVDLGQSMAGGGGPACLRLKVPLRTRQLAGLCETSRWTDKLDQSLERIIRDGYPTSLELDDLLSIERVRHAEAIRNQIAVQLGREILS